MTSIALITGASKGIGFEVARKLLERNYHVILTARSHAKAVKACAMLKSLNCEPLELELTKDKSVAAALETVKSKFGQIDVLVNNAGILIDKGIAPSALQIEQLYQTLDSNLIGAIRVTNAFLPLLKKSSSPRIINVSSTWGSLNSLSESEGAAPAYHISKAALNMWTVILAKELAGISVNSICPGWVKTDMGGTEALKTVDQGAAIILKLATDKNPPTGKFLDDNGEISW